MILSLEESVALEARHKFNTYFKEGSLYTVNISPGKDVQTVAPTIRHIPWRLTVQHSTGIYP